MTFTSFVFTSRTQWELVCCGVATRQDPEPWESGSLGVFRQFAAKPV